ncbi:TetR family transcriptional regulator [Actinoplanes sp. SE50]|uniref:TetR/AcrR family transcriptional regulator n=1 Tax=unclassified Actinoplanes TaxID=2626549 RepID=UPI00023EC1D3|nr:MULTISPECIES: TetR/AcrR family transcriptional regulator [unclassified Actinoplanes]AEV81337.1 Tetracycline repressor protein class E [Actinoplanes sp. SE50/110]ATO79740.1 TetR family transcriptional regulator [Actinoplanes sp. SE50]SLL97143.1 TetR family transcriptional regulator [Actinoplanes sp. SE50/110]
MAEARRTMDLLWFPEAVERKRGRRPGLSVARVVETGIALADAEGLEGVSMRRVATELGVVPMTLYTYVPDKATLLELMLDRVYLAMPRAELPGRSWRDRAAAIAEENRALVAAHPWVAAMPASRPPLGPGLMAKYEHELRAFDGCGLDDVTVDSALTFLLGFVQAAARAAAEVRATAERAHQTDWEWWQERGPALQVVLDEHTYPTAARVGAAAGAALGAAYDPDHAYEFGLRRVLDGLAALIDGEPAGDPGR